MNTAKCSRICDNKTELGYCKTTACINPMYSNIGTAQYRQGVQRNIITNADRIRTMTDEELAEWVRQYGDCILTHCCACDICVPTMEDMSCKDWILKWLKQEVKE